MRSDEGRNGDDPSDGKTRDLLEAQALRSEREAALIDAADHAACDDECTWETALQDGIV